MDIGSKLGGLIIITINRPNPHNHQSRSRRDPNIPIHPGFSVPGCRSSVFCPLPSVFWPVLFMQNKPNSQNQETSLTPYPKKHYAKTSPLRPQENKPNSNPIPNTPSAPRPALPGNQSKSLSPKSAQISLSAHKSGAKTSKNHNTFMQNKPNPKNTKTTLTLLTTKDYEDNPPRPTRKNKPNSNPIEANSPAQIDETNPIQTQFKPVDAPTAGQSPRPSHTKSAIRYPLSAARYTNPIPSSSRMQTLTEERFFPLYYNIPGTNNRSLRPISVCSNRLRPSSPSRQQSCSCSPKVAAPLPRPRPDASYTASISSSPPTSRPQHEMQDHPCT